MTRIVEAAHRDNGHLVREVHKFRRSLGAGHLPEALERLARIEEHARRSLAWEEHRVDPVVLELGRDADVDVLDHDAADHYGIRRLLDEIHALRSRGEAGERGLDRPLQEAVDLLEDRWKIHARDDEEPLCRTAEHLLSRHAAQAAAGCLGNASERTCEDFPSLIAETRAEAYARYCRRCRTGVCGSEWEDWMLAQRDVLMRHGILDPHTTAPL